MTEEDPFLRDFGISSSDLHAELVLLRERLVTADKQKGSSEHEIMLDRMSYSTTSVAMFLAEIPDFFDRQLMNCQDLIVHDLDLVMCGSSARFIRPRKRGKGRPKTPELFKAQRGWAAAYMQHLINGGLNVDQASRKAARDIDAKNRRFSGTWRGGSLTPSSVKKWRELCSGIGAEKGVMKSTYDDVLVTFGKSKLEQALKREFVLDIPNRDKVSHPKSK